MFWTTQDHGFLLTSTPEPTHRGPVSRPFETLQQSYLLRRYDWTLPGTHPSPTFFQKVLGGLGRPLLNPCVTWIGGSTITTLILSPTQPHSSVEVRIAASRARRCATRFGEKGGIETKQGSKPVLSFLFFGTPRAAQVGPTGIQSYRTEDTTPGTSVSVLTGTSEGGSGSHRRMGDLRTMGRSKPRGPFSGSWSVWPGNLAPFWGPANRSVLVSCEMSCMVRIFMFAFGPNEVTYSVHQKRIIACVRT